MNNIAISQRIKSVREEKGITQDDIARELGLNKSTVLRYEKGEIKNIKLPIIQAMAEYLGVSPDWLIGKSEEKYATEKPVSDRRLKFALFGDAEIDDDILDEVKLAAKLLQQMKAEREKSGDK